MRVCSSTTFLQDADYLTAEPDPGLQPCLGLWHIPVKERQSLSAGCSAAGPVRALGQHLALLYGAPFKGVFQGTEHLLILLCAREIDQAVPAAFPFPTGGEFTSVL